MYNIIIYVYILHTYKITCITISIVFKAGSWLDQNWKVNIGFPFVFLIHNNHRIETTPGPLTDNGEEECDISTRWNSLQQ